MYAGDLDLLSESASGLQASLSKLQEYCTTRKLTLNPSKTKVIIFNKSGRLLNTTPFYYNQNVIEVRNRYCYLGIEFSASGVFTSAIDKGRIKLTRLYLNYVNIPLTIV